MTAYALPSDIPTVRVHGTYVGPDGTPLAGSVTFTGPGLLTFAGSDLFIAGPVSAKLDANGHFETALPATDFEGMNPNGWSYTVKENLTGVMGSRTYALLLTSAMGEIDLADVAPADPSTPNYVPVEGLTAYDIAVSNGFEGTEADWLLTLRGEPGVLTTVNGKTGSSVTLSASDVGALPALDPIASDAITIDGPAGTYRKIQFTTAGSLRWMLQATSAAESGNNAGTALDLSAWSDTGQYIATTLAVSRATGSVSFGDGAPLAGARMSVAGAMALKNATAPVVVATASQLYSAAGKPWAVQGDGKAVALGTGVAAAGTASGAYVGQYRDGAVAGSLDRWNGTAWTPYDTGWVTLPMPTGYARFSTNGADIQIRRMGTMVYLRGRISRTAGNIPTGETFTGLIPASFRPTGPAGGYCDIQLSTSAIAPAVTGTVRAEVYVNGNVVIGNATALGSPWIGFGGGTLWAID